MKRASFVSATLCAAMTACTRVGPPVTASDLNGNLAVLQSAFNENSDRVRLILLLSPT